MNVMAVESATLVALAYDEVGQVLRLEFRSRTIYQYFGVPAAVHQALLMAPSKGIYFNRFIRANFPYCLVSNAQAAISSGALWPERSRR
jgi:hypothetical protein